MYTCTICEDETRLDGWWKCETCVFECHEQCIKKWFLFSGNRNCPHCRGLINPLKDVFTREEILAVCCVLCLTPEALPASFPSEPGRLVDDITSLD